jgi:hypothetical protein
MAHTIAQFSRDDKRLETAKTRGCERAKARAMPCKVARRRDPYEPSASENFVDGGSNRLQAPVAIEALSAGQAQDGSV